MKIDELHPGLELGPSDWLTIEQSRIDAFAASTEDRQWLHTDPGRAAAGPFGATVAHSFLTLALAIKFWDEVARLEGVELTVNYGLDRVRFPAPVPAGSRIRGRFRIQQVEPVDGGVQAAVAATIEREGEQKPACVANLLLRVVRAAS
ncbi:MAG: MaoC family dehydratase [Actinomycetota bacterium]|nr:MaoC family dehydratase [Actinomycetota bacterium]